MDTGPTDEQKAAFLRAEDVFYEQGARRGWFTGLGRPSPSIEEPKNNITEIITTADPGPTTSGSGHSGWKPLAISTPILSAIIALTLLLAAAIETLAQRSAASGGLALSPTLHDVPRYAMLSYLYVPTTVAVLYSLIWSWIDLDVKRMQPWFEMSKDEGATAENSLFLDYQYNFVASVPFKAAKRRHWPVFYAGTAMVIVLWLLTPLQSALLGTGIILKKEDGMLMGRSTLRPVAEQKSLVEMGLLNEAYAVAWLDQPFPSFTTANYALEPFYAGEKPSSVAPAVNWTAPTTKYWTELSCWPAVIPSHTGNTTEPNSYITSMGKPSNGQGCTASDAVDIGSRDAQYVLDYSGYGGPDPRARGLFYENCTVPDVTHQILLMWNMMTNWPPEDGKPAMYNVTAKFCQTIYYKQRVLATVSSDTLEPDAYSISPLAEKEILTDKEFDSAAFEYLLYYGYPFTNHSEGLPYNHRNYEYPVDDYPKSKQIRQDSKLNGTGIAAGKRPMIAFALAGQNYTALDYSSPEILEESFSHAHQYLFSLAVHKLLVNETDFSSTTVSIQAAFSGIVVSRVFSIVVECILLLVACLTAVLLWYCRRAKCNLPANPSSINRLLELARNSPSLLNSFQTTDNADDKALRKMFEPASFKLTYDEAAQCGRIYMIQGTQTLQHATDRKPDIQKGFYKPIRPFVLQRMTGIAFMLGIMGIMIGLSCLKQKEADLNGLQRPRTSFEVLQFLENYLPTILATLVEPFWVLLTRLLSGLQPFKELWEGKAQPATSIDATYTAVPPQFVMWRAAKSKHFILVLVCLMAFLSNLLAVGLGSLFNESPVIANYSGLVLPVHTPQFDNSSVYSLADRLKQEGVTRDHMYVYLANMTSGTALPPWIAQEYYFQRHDLGGLNKTHGEDTYTVSTRGFGVAPSCIGVPAPEFGYEVDAPNNFTVVKSCPDNVGNVLARFRSPYIKGRTPNRSAAEYAEAVNPSYTNTSECPFMFTLGWARTDNSTYENSTIYAEFATCRPTLQTAMFNVTLNQDGRVLSYERTSDLETSLGYPDSELHASIVLETFKSFSRDDAMVWHNTSFTQDWFNHFMMLELGSRDIVDPSKPLPDLDVIIPALEHVYRRSFVIFLGLYARHMFGTSSGDGSTVILHTKETRIFMENVSFIITITLLAMNVIVALIFYVRAVAFVLPRMPTTMGSILAYVAPSRLASSSYKNTPGHTSRTFSFGRYVGKDGEVHLGVEIDPYVVPIDPKSLRSRGGLRRRFGTRETGEGESFMKKGTWL